MAVVDQVEQGELPYSQAQERYGIQGDQQCWQGVVMA
jgi:hypothetical protein